MPGSKCMGLHCVPERERKVGGRSGKDGHARVAIVFAVQQPWAVSTANTKPCKQYTYRCCTYPKILNHINYRVAPFLLHSCFIMKTEMNRDFRSSVLFGFCFVLFLSCQTPSSYRATQSGALAALLPLQPCCSARRRGCCDSGGAIHTRIH